MDHLHSATIALLFQPVLNCPLTDGSIPFMFANCEDYHNNVAQEMRHRSFVVGGYWAAVLASALIGHVLTFYGFGTASERLNKRVRDSSFAALLRQEVAFFDKRSVGRITSQLQDDAAKIHAFLGEPIRSFIIAIASFLTGIFISFLVSCALSIHVSFASLLTSEWFQHKFLVYVAFCPSGNWMHPSNAFCNFSAHEANAWD